MQLQPWPRRVVCAAWDGEGAQSAFNYLLKVAINLCLSTHLHGNASELQCLMS